MARPLVRETIKLPQILLLNSSGGGFSVQGPLAFVSGFHGLQAVGLVCKFLASALRKSASMLKCLVRRNLKQKLVPFKFSCRGFSEMLRQHHVWLVGAFPNDCVSGLKTPIIDMMNFLNDVSPHFCYMGLTVRDGE